MIEETKTVRSCGGCTACCKVFPIEVLKKKANEWCTHCSIGIGCGIYESRPVPCKTYRCLWLTGHGDEEDRPDKSRVVLDLMEDLEGNFTVFRMQEVSEGALESAFARRTIAQALGTGLVVYRVSLSSGDTVLVRKGYPFPRVVKQFQDAGVAIFQLAVRMI